VIQVKHMTQNQKPRPKIIDPYKWLDPIAEQICNHIIDDLYYYKEPALGVLHEKCKHITKYQLINLVEYVSELLP